MVLMQLQNKAESTWKDLHDFVFADILQFQPWPIKTENKYLIKQNINGVLITALHKTH